MAAFAAIVLFASSAAAAPDGSGGGSGVTDPALLALITDDDLFATMNVSVLLDPPVGAGTPTQHFGSHPSSSEDSGTCGGDPWANGYFDRDFTVRTSATGAITVVEQFKNGSFTANDSPSPGACDQSDGTPPGTVDAGIVGSIHGYFIIPLPAGTMQTSTSPYCDADLMTNDDCTTTSFIDTHFTPCYSDVIGTCPVTTFFFHYSAGDQELAVHEWKNASCDRGGNHGAIASDNVAITPPFPPLTLCP